MEIMEDSLDKEVFLAKVASFREETPRSLVFVQGTACSGQEQVVQ